MTTTVRHKRDTAANWTSSNRLLALGQIGIETDTGFYKTGNGVTLWNSLPYKGGPVSPFVLTLLDDAAASNFMTTLGFTGAAQTLIALGDVIGLEITSGTVLTNAQIIALPTTPVSINIAPSSGFIALPKSAYVKVNSNAGIYTNINAGCLIQFTFTSGQAMLADLDEGDGFVTALLGTGTAAGDAATTRAVGAAGTLASFEADALRISANNQGSGNFTGGNAANSGLVKVEWTLVPVS